MKTPNVTSPPVVVVDQRLMELVVQGKHFSRSGRIRAKSLDHRLILDDHGKRLAKRDDARALSKYRAEGATPADIGRLVGL
jgi:hypothetical protein